MLETSIRNSPMITPEFMSTRNPPFGLHQSIKADSVLEREIAFRDHCSSALGRSSFADVLRMASADSAALDSFMVRSANILGLTEHVRSEPIDSVDQLFLALAPPLRLDMLHLTTEAILRALALAEFLFRRAWSLSEVPPTPHGAYALIQTFGPMLRLLARGDEPLDLPDSVRVDSPPFDDADLAFTAFIAIREMRRPAGVIGALENAIKPSLTVSDRSVLLKQIGSAIEEAYMKRRKKR